LSCIFSKERAIKDNKGTKMKTKTWPKHIKPRDGKLGNKWVLRNPFKDNQGRRPRKTLDLICDGTKANQDQAIRLRDQYLKPWYDNAETKDKNKALEQVRVEILKNNEGLRIKQFKTNDIRLSEAILLCYNERWKGQKECQRVLRKGQFIVEALNNPMLSEINSKDISEFRAELAKTRAVSTVNSYITIIKVILEMAVDDWEILERAPKVKLKRTDNARQFTVSRELELKLYDCLKIENCQPHWSWPRYTDLFIFLIDTGFRVNEAMNQKMANINFTHKTLSVAKEDAKTKASIRTIRMTDRVYEICCRYRDEGSRALFNDLSYHSITKYIIPYLRNEIMNKYADLVPENFEPADFVCHTFRHTLCSRLWMAEVDIKSIMSFMGHTDIKTTLRYAHLRTDWADAAIDKLNALNSKGGT